jgi:hypothetical protein
MSEDIAACGLTLSELQELWLGPGPLGSLFHSREELQDAWIQGRDVVMRLWGSHGRRPQAWWCFDAPGLGLKWPTYNYEQSYLYTSGVLTEVEKVELERGWWREFELAQAPGFSVSTGAEILKGDRAWIAHYRWADIPDELVAKWKAERSRRGRQSAPLEEAAATGTAD